MCQRTEEETENRHGQKWLKDGPGRADRCLLVANFQVAPDKEIEQFAKVPKVAKIEVEPTARRGNRHINCQGLSQTGRFCCNTHGLSLAVTSKLHILL